MANNPILFNSALAGAIGGSKTCRVITNPSAATYLADRNAALAFATRVDAAIPASPAVSSPNAAMMLAITNSILSNKAITASMDNVNIALAIAGLYNEMVPAMLPEVLPNSAEYYVQNFGAIGDGIADDTAAINAAIAAAIAIPGKIYLMRAHRITAALTTLSNNNISLIGRGEFNGGTTLIIDVNPLPAQVIRITAQYCSVENIWCISNFASATGFYIKLDGAYRPYLKNIQISGYGNGVDIDSCVGAYLERCQFNDTFGRYGFYVHGTNPFFCHATVFDHCQTGTVYLQTVTGTPAAWAPATAYVAGNIVTANGSIWQCFVGGNSAGAGTGPSGLPTNSPLTVHTTNVVDGTVQWRFVMGQHSGFVHGSFAHTVILETCGALQGDIGLEIVDDAPAAGSQPTFTHSWQFSSDHPFNRGLKCTVANAMWHDQLLVTSVLAGDGVEIASGVNGYEFNSGQIFGTARNGMTIAGSGGGVIHDTEFAAIGSPANTFDGIAVANNAQKFRIHDCRIGDATGFASGMRYGISIGTGCDNFKVHDNELIGNDTGPILCNVELSSTKIIRNNLPESAYYDAPDGVLKLTLAGGVQTLTIADPKVHTVIVSPTGNVVFDTILHAGAIVTANTGIRLKIIREGAPGFTVAFRDGNASLNAIWTPSSVDFVLSSFNDEVDLQQLQTTALGGTIRWRILARAKRIATISVAVPALAAAVTGYVNVNLAGTALQGMLVTDTIEANPTADLAAAGAAGGYYVNCRISATDTARLLFVGTLAGGNVNFIFTQTN